MKGVIVMQPEIAEIHPVKAGDDELRQCYEAIWATYAADYPSRPVAPYVSWEQQIRMPTSMLGPQRLWAARVGGRIVAAATVAFPEQENRQLTITTVQVPAPLRRRGIGTALLHATLPGTRAEGRSTVTGGLKAGGDGERWALGLGFEKVEERVLQNLVVSDVDPGRWDVPAPAGFRAERWIGAAPEPLVAGYARARTAISDAPTGRSNDKVPDWTTQRVRSYEAEIRDRDCELWTVVAVHESSGTIAGLTEMELRPGRPLGIQLDTAVLGEYRGHGLGQFIKAAMMRWLLADRPQIAMVATNTDAGNVHMIRVNHQLGYVTDAAISKVEADVETVDRKCRNPTAGPHSRCSPATAPAPAAPAPGAPTTAS
jgi:mycothiol synthase